MRLVLIYLTGLTFGIGISISGMANPAKVINFFDVAGTWDPSLAFVMASALMVTFFGYRFVLGRKQPLFEKRFFVPTNRVIDQRLIGGSAIFGVGWGIAGFCPGAVLPVVGTLNGSVLVFFAALVGGILSTKAILKISSVIFLNTRGSSQI